MLTRENELKAEEIRLEEMKRVLEESAKKVQQQNAPTTTTERWLEGSVLGMQTGDKRTQLRQWGAMLVSTFMGKAARREYRMYSGAADIGQVGQGYPAWR